MVMALLLAIILFYGIIKARLPTVQKAYSNTQLFKIDFEKNCAACNPSIKQYCKTWSNSHNRIKVRSDCKGGKRYGLHFHCIAYRRNVRLCRL